MVKCNNCGAENLDHANFCMECGASLMQPFEFTNDNYNEQGAWSDTDRAYQEQHQWQNQQNSEWQSAPQQGPDYGAPYRTDGFGDRQYGEKNKISAGLLAIFLGSLGIHKFYLGYTSTGVITLLVSVLTLGIGAVVMEIIGIVEGIIYLTKNDYDFYQTYEVRQKKWF